MSKPTDEDRKAIARRQELLDDFDAWLKKEYNQGVKVDEVVSKHYLWMKDAYGAGDERGRKSMRTAVLKLITGLPAVQYLKLLPLYRKVMQLD